MSVSLETLAEINDRTQTAQQTSDSSLEPVPRPTDRLRIARGIVFGLGISLCLWLGIAMIVLWSHGGAP